MMQRHVGKSRYAAKLLGTVLLAGAFGCQQQKQSDTGKTFTSDQKTPKGGDSQSGAANDAKPLNSPADTTNGKSSRASDTGSSEATHGQVVAEPGAPVEHEPRPATPKAAPDGGH